MYTEPLTTSVSNNFAVGFHPFQEPLSYGVRANSLNGAIKCLGKKSH